MNTEDFKDYSKNLIEADLAVIRKKYKVPSPAQKYRIELLEYALSKLDDSAYVKEAFDQFELRNYRKCTHLSSNKIAGAFSRIDL